MIAIPSGNVPGIFGGVCSKANGPPVDIPRTIARKSLRNGIVVLFWKFLFTGGRFTGDYRLRFIQSAESSFNVALCAMFFIFSISSSFFREILTLIYDISLGIK